MITICFNSTEKFDNNRTLINDLRLHKHDHTQDNLVSADAETSTASFMILSKQAVNHVKDLLHNGILTQVISTLEQHNNIEQLHKSM